MNARVETSPRTVDSARGARQKVTPRQMAHVVLKTNQYEKMIDWWQTVLDAQVVLQRPNATFLTFDEEHHRVAIVNVPRLRPSDVNRCGVDHIAYTYAELPDLLYTYKRLRDRGIRPRWCPGSILLLSLYYQDPDGNRVQIQWDVNSSAEQMERFQNDPSFVTNPFGAPFDPEDLLRAYESGASIETILKIPQYPAGTAFKDIMNEMGLGDIDVTNG